MKFDFKGNVTVLFQKYFLSIALGLITVIASGALADTPVPVNSHVTAELISDHGSIASNSQFRLGVRFVIEEGWHIYWMNPGDSGLATKVTLTAPSGFVVNDLQWPTPEKIVASELVNFGYEKEVLLYADARSPELSAEAKQDFSASVRWIACKDECIPGAAHLDLSIPKVANATLVTTASSQPLFALTQQHLPKVVGGSPFLSATVNKGVISVTLPGDELSADAQTSGIFIPSDKETFDYKAPQTYQANSKDSFTVQWSDPKLSLTPMPVVAGIIVLSNDALHATKSFQVNLPLTAATPTTSAPFGIKAFFIAIFGAFLGGVILNVMPCVFPVLSIKVMGFLDHSVHDAKKQGLCFSAGVILSFWFLGGLLLILRAFGSQLGWGFQFQSPIFVTVMGLVIFTFGLNLVGLFEMGSSLQSLSGSVKVDKGYKGSFLSGVLATTLATPCTAPFMGSALAVALGQSSIIAVLIFTSLGIGMSTPYLLLSFFPKGLAYLPKPGEWMNGMKQLLAFPLFATVLWLMWVLGNQIDADAVIRFATGALVLAFGLWIFGRWCAPHQSNMWRRIGFIVTSALLVASVYVAYPVEAVKRDELSMQATKAHDQWEPFSKARLKELVANKQPVFVDFTAAWCLTCQINHKMVLDSEVVVAAFKEKGVTLLRGDWTNRNEEISKVIEEHGKSGVPLDIVYSPSGKTKILAPVLTQQIVLAAIGVK